MSEFQIIAVANGCSIDASESIFTGTKREARFAATILGDKTRSALKDTTAKALLYSLSGCAIEQKVGEY